VQSSPAIVREPDGCDYFFFAGFFAVDRFVAVLARAGFVAFFFAAIRVYPLYLAGNGQSAAMPTKEISQLPHIVQRHVNAPTFCVLPS
jgi:hypothetical protein